MKPELEAKTEGAQAAFSASGLLADMQRCLLWMEHENRCAEREEKMGYWLTDHSEAMRQWDAEYLKARDAYMSANDQAQ
jgi:hypothetical protein